MSVDQAAEVTRVTKFRTKKPRFELVPFVDIRLDHQRRNYLIKGLLSRTGLTVIWGPPKCGKSFWALDLAMHIALRWKYRSRRVQGGPVVYVALEGQEGFKARIEAFRQHHNVTEAEFYLVTVPLNLIVDHAALIVEIQDQLGGVQPVAVFIDTLNRSLVGSESKDEDMAKYLGAADAVAAQLACKVVIIHHCGIDATRPRGHTSLTGSVEEQIAVKREGDGQFSATVEFAKDMAERETIHSHFQVVTVGTDPDGDPITSLIVMPAAEPVTAKKAGKKITGANAAALAILRRAIDDAGQIAPASNHIPPDTRTIAEDEWRRYAYLGTITESDKPDSKRRAFTRAVKNLQNAGLIGIWNGQVWIMP
jgi:hypothetical protein